MSYYYNYYVGYKKDNKFYPLGPYNSEGTLCTALSRSSSFASHLHRQFDLISEDMKSDELLAAFPPYGEGKVAIKYLPVDKLPTGSFIKQGYFLIEDVDKYENNGNDAYDLFYEYLTPIVYTAKVQNAHLFEKNSNKNDEHDISEYMFYAYPDYDSEEYESIILKAVADNLENYDLNNVEYVILETEG